MNNELILSFLLENLDKREKVMNNPKKLNKRDTNK